MGWWGVDIVVGDAPPRIPLAKFYQMRYNIIGLSLRRARSLPVKGGDAMDTYVTLELLLALGSFVLVVIALCKQDK